MLRNQTGGKLQFFTLGKGKRRDASKNKRCGGKLPKVSAAA